MDVERYQKVLHQCCLERDLELFDAGDATEVGEKVPLSFRLQNEFLTQISGFDAERWPEGSCHSCASDLRGHCHHFIG